MVVANVRPALPLDPELAAISVLIPELDLRDVERARKIEAELASQGRTPTAGVAVEDVIIESRSGGQLRLRVYRPAVRGALPVHLYLHGGGFVLGGLDSEDDRCASYARDAGCVVVAVDYRLAPEHPFPAAFEDAIDALRWVHGAADDVGVDTRRMGIGGNSAGGSIAAAVALSSRLDDVPTLVHQLLINPALDSRCESASMAWFADAPGWTRDNSVLMWSHYLRDGEASTDFRASPARATRLEDAPAASIWLAEFDPLRDEGHEYARRLMAAHVSVGIVQYPGTFHGYDGYRMTSLGQRALRDQVASLRWAFRN